jgi:hypothetical protein
LKFCQLNERWKGGLATTCATALLLLGCSLTASANPAVTSPADAELKNWEAGKSCPFDAKAAANGKTDTWCKAKTTIKAPPDVVWRIVHEERQHDPDLSYTKVLEQGENEYKLEQKFNFIPVLGSSVCVTHHKEVPFQRIDYTLVKSDHFKAMEGSWTFESTDGGKSTILQLSSHLDLGLPIPKMFMNSISTKKIEKRLAHIKQMAESTHSVALKEHPVQ